MSKRETMTTSGGAPIADNQNSISAGAGVAQALGVSRAFDAAE